MRQEGVVIEKILLTSDGSGAWTAAAVASPIAAAPTTVVREPGSRL